jgi:hypothetical protein
MLYTIHPAFIEYQNIPKNKDLNIIQTFHPASITKENIILYNNKYLKYKKKYINSKKILSNYI